MKEQELTEYFLEAISYCKKIGYDTKRVYYISPDTIKPQHFFKEYVWVVYACNFRVNILEQRKVNLYRAYGNYRTLNEGKRDAVLAVIDNVTKWTAVLDTVRIMRNVGWQGEFGFKEVYLSTIDSMTRLKFIKDVTKFHLARNLGFDVAKPDRWMKRLAESFECESVTQMCLYLSEKYGLMIKEIDIILWKYASDCGV